MTMRRYEVVRTERITVDIDDACIERTQTGEYADQFYDITEDQAVVMLADALALGRRLSNIDGWADLPDELAALVEHRSLEAEVRKVVPPSGLPTARLEGG